MTSNGLQDDNTVRMIDDECGMIETPYNMTAKEGRCGISESTGAFFHRYLQYPRSAPSEIRDVEEWMIFIIMRWMYLSTSGARGVYIYSSSTEYLVPLPCLSLPHDT